MRITAAGIVHVVALVFLHQPVVGRVVYTAKAERRPHMVAFTRVVVHHVQDHFYTFECAAPRTIALNSLHLLALQFPSAL